jgi:hypothetical protein
MENYHYYFLRIFRENTCKQYSTLDNPYGYFNTMNTGQLKINNYK